MTLSQLTAFALSLTKDQDKAKLIATKVWNKVENRGLTGWNRRAALLVGVRDEIIKESYIII